MTPDSPEDVAEASIELANHMELTGQMVLANLKNHMELFQPEDIEAGIWAYREVAKALGETILS